MNRISKFSWKKFIFSVVFNGAVLVAALLIFVPFFEEIDDTHIAMIVEGAFGVKEWHVVYPNVIIGRLYVLLQTLAPTVRWHVILQYVFIYVAYVFGTYVISKHKRGIFISIASVLATFYELYVSVQYTKSAAFVSAVGFLLIFEYVRNVTNLANVNDTILSTKNKGKSLENKVFVVVAFILVIYGALLRPESVFIAAVPAAAAGILELLRTKNIIKYLISFGPLFAIVVLLHVFNSYVYSMDLEWSDFMKYNQARMQLNDYRYDILDFTKYADELNSLNVSENDALAILTYQFGDDNILSYERLAEIRAPFPARHFGYMTFANLFENLVNEILRSYTLLVGMAGIVLVLIASIVTDRSKSSPGFIKDSRRKLIYMVLTALFCGAAIIYFQYSGRYSHRLIGAIVIPTIFIVCFEIDSIFIRENDSKIIFGGNKNDVTMSAGIVISVVLIGLNGLYYLNNVNEFAAWQSENAPILRELEEMSKDKSTLYVADTFTFQNIHKFDLFGTADEGYLDNFVTCGSWFMNSPITKRITNKYGYSNPFDALKSCNENVVLLDNQGVECKTLFLTEHYDNVYSAIKLENRGGINVYKMSVLEE